MRALRTWDAPSGVAIQTGLSGNSSNLDRPVWMCQGKTRSDSLKTDRLSAIVARMSAKAPSPQERSAAARARLLAAANELFYAEGVQIGRDRPGHRARRSREGHAVQRLRQQGRPGPRLPPGTARRDRRAHGARARSPLRHPERAPGRRVRGAGPVVHRAGVPRLRVRQRERRRPTRRCRRTRRAGLPHLAARAVLSTSPSRQAPRTRSHSPSNWSCSTTAPGSAPGWTATPAPRQRPAP